MKLWIRSQNKCELWETNLVNYSYDVRKHIIDCNGYPVGTYATKKRCLEIIDEIQNLLLNNGSTDDRIAQIVSGIENKFIVYEMPEK